LEQLADGLPKTRAELASALGLTKSTVYKQAKELERHGLVNQTQDGYEVTAVGEVARRKLEELEGVTYLKNLSTNTGLEAVDLEFLVGAEVILPGKPAPHQVFDELKSFVDRSNHLESVSPVVLPFYVELFYEKVVEGSLSAHFIFDEEAFLHLRDSYRSELQESKKGHDLGRKLYRRSKDWGDTTWAEGAWAKSLKQTSARRA